MSAPSILKKFDSILTHRPLVVGTLTGNISLAGQVREAHAAPVDIIEIRLDTFDFNKTRAPEFLATVRRMTKKPLLLTLRSGKEGGDKRFQKFIGNKDKEKFFRAILPFGDLIDLEIRDKSLLKRITQRARSKGISVIHSLHDFKKMPPRGILNQSARESIRLKGDFFKVAVAVKNPEDLRKFFDWGLDCPHPRPVLIAMGRAGEVSRILGYCFGSPLTFGHLGRSAAPGQLKARDLTQAIGNIFPKDF